MFIEFFARKPVFAAVCSIIIFFIGLISIPSLPVAQYPQLAPPQITVTTNYIGANAQTVETAVTTPLEQAINGVQGMKYITSTSGNDGTSMINVIFNQDRSLDDALLDVQTRVKQVEARLPAEVKMTGITIDKYSSAMILMYVLHSKNGEYDSSFLSNYADRYMKDYIKRVDGVSNVMIFGERKFAMRLWLDPFKLASRGLTASDVVNALSEQNVQVSAGQVGGAPSNKSQTVQMNITTSGRLKSPDEFNDIIIKTGQNGLVRLKDVGRAELGAEDYSLISHFNGQDAVGIGIYQLPSANALSVATKVKKQVAELEKSFPPGIVNELSIDASKVVTESIKEVLITLLGSILLVIAVIYVFLQNWRTTIIPVITIPVSLVGTFVLLKLFGFSINTLTLFGIVLATGLVVDDAIIVVENIERFIREKRMSPMNAAIEGMKEIFGAVIATSLVLIAVFVPVAFFPGTTGQLYKQFALTIAFAITISAFVSITLTPAMSALLLRRKIKHMPIFDKVNAVLDNITEKYKQLLGLVLSHQKIVLIGFGILLGATILLFKIVPQSFVPVEDQSYFMSMVQAPEGTSLEGTQKIINKVDAIIRKDPDVKDSFTFAGYSFTGISANKGILYVILKPLDERKGSNHSCKEVVNRLNAELAGLPDAIVASFEPPAVDGIGTVGGFQFEIKDQANHDLDTLNTATQNVIAEGSKSPKLTGLFTTFTANSPQLDIKVDKFKAKQMGLSLNDIYSTIQVFLGSAYVNDFNYLNKIYRVYVQADKSFRTTPDSIGQLYVRGQNGAMMPLSNLITTSKIYTSETINHYNLLRSAEITGSSPAGVSTGQAIKEMEAVAKKALPQNFSYEWSGLALEQQESGSQTIVIFLLSFIFVFLILVAQYENIFSPIIILLAVPLAIFGAMLAQLTRGLENDVFCQIGLVMLIGLASKNAILIVEFANQLREQGLQIVEAVSQAAIIRFRPIVMTSLACILGILPLVLATGAGSASRKTMGTAVFGGMIVSTILNLLLVPVLYILITSFQEKIKQNRKLEIKANLLKKLRREKR
jgi:hydrophobic/amphiphilic exporter-1 (mainly G- bacteria), HAE1 family